MRNLRRIVNPKRGDPKKIIVNDLELIASYLGKGLFAKAYRVDDRVYIFATDPMKDAIAEIRRYEGQGENPHIPLVERIGMDERTGDNIYLMPYYEPLSAKHKSAWNHARIIQREHERLIGQLGFNYTGYALADTLRNGEGFPKSLADAIEEMSNWALNYGTPGMEFNKANLSVSDGKLILRDVLFDRELLDRYRKAKMQRMNLRARR